MIRQLLILLFFGLCAIVHSHAQPDTSAPVNAVDPPADQVDSALTASIDRVIVADSTLADTSLQAETKEIILDEEPAPVQERNVRQKTWAFMLFVLVLIIIGFTRSINLKKHYNLIRETLRIRSSSAGFDNEISDITIQNILYLFLQCLVIAYVFYSLFDYEGVIAFHSGFQAFLFTLIMVIGVYMIKFFIYRIVTVILDIREIMPVLFAIQTSIGYLFSLAAFPVIVLAYYVKSDSGVTLFYSILGFIGVAYVLYRFVKVSLILSQAVRLPLIYLFLYLCTLEITPLLVMINWLGFGWV